MATYPGGIVSFTRQVNQGTPVIDEFSLDADDVNIPYDEIEAIEEELGIDPAGSEATVADRLTAIEETINPSGIIVMWSGLLANIPSGWSLCDGTSGTPDMLDRFVVSVPDNATNPGDTGGSHQITLTLAQLPNVNTGAGTAHGHTQNSHSHSQNTHSHGVNESSQGEHAHACRGKALFASGSAVSAVRPDGNLYWGGGNPIYSNGAHTHGVSTNPSTPTINPATATNNPESSHVHPLGGSGGSHENRPLYYELAFIMKD